MGTITEATTYNRYTGPVDYVGIIPNKDYFTKYPLDSPNGIYNVQNSEVVPVQGSSKLVRTDGYKVFEGSAPVIQDRGRDVEIDVTGKVLVKLDESRLGNGVTVGVDTDAVTAQVVTSPNNLINTEYRDFNGTRKFVLFEGEAQVSPLEFLPYGDTSNCRRCSSMAPHVVFIQSYGSLRVAQMYADYQRATAPLTLDAYVSDVEESLIDSNATLSATYGHSVNGRPTVDTWRLPGAYDAVPTFVDGLWHVTSLLTESEYSVETEQGTANGTVAAQGTYRVTDPTPYVVHGTVGPDSFKSIPTPTNSNVYVLLEGLENEQTYVVSDIIEDVTPPVVESIERHNPSDLVINGDMMVYNVTFSEDVTGVDADDFVLTPGSTGGRNTDMQTTQTSSPSLDIIGERTVSDTITVSDPSMVTSVAVAVNITDANIHGLTITLVAPDGTRETLRAQTSGPDDLNESYSWSFDSLPIAGDWELRIHDRFRFTNGILHDWALTFISHDDSSPVTSVSGSGDTYYATVPAVQEGTYRIDFGFDHGITDIRGNPLIDRIPVVDIDREYIVTGTTDVTSPSVSAIERSNPIAQNTNSRTLVYKVTFSETVTGVDAFDFVLSPDSTGRTIDNDYPVESITGSGDTYHVTVSATQDGTYNLDLVVGHGIIDATSNPLTDRVPTTGLDETYVKTVFTDRDEPTISSIDRYDPMVKNTDSETLVYEVTFSEDVTGVDKADFVMSSGSTGKPLFTFHPSDSFSSTSSPNIAYGGRGIMSDTITVPNVGTATSVRVAVDIDYAAIGFLEVDLIAPDGTAMRLHNRTGGYNDDIKMAYSPDFSGVPIAGNWTLQVYKASSYSTARLNDWALTINHGSPYHVTSLSGAGDTYYATVFATQNGTYNLDLIPSGHGIEDTAGNDLTDTSTGAGIARISANGIVGAGNVQINGLPRGVPWILEAVDGPQVNSGLTSSSGSITMPLPDYSIDGVTEEFSLLVYEDGFGQNVQPGNVVADTINKEFVRHDFVNPTQNVIYIPERFMLYPITVPVTIGDVRLGKVSTDCNVTDQVRLRYLDGAYDVGSTMHVPFIPGMSALQLSLDGAPVCVKFADVLPPVQIIPFSGDVAAEKNAPLINLEVNGGASTILGTNDPTTLTVSFPASGFSEHSRYTNLLSVTITGQDGRTITCNANLHFADNSGISPSSCPEPAASMFMAMHSGYTREMAVALEHAFTKYEVTIDVFKNGHLYDTATLPLNSLNVNPPTDLETTFNLGRCWVARGLNTIPSHVNQTTAYTGGHYFGQLACTTNPPNALFHATGGTAWSELVTHTFDITDGRIGDHIEVQISNEVTFSFPYFFGHYHPYNSEIAHYDWPSTFSTEILNGDDFLGVYDKLEFDVYVVYGANDRGVLVQINNGFIMVTPAS